MSRGNFRQRVFLDEDHYLRGLCIYVDQASDRYGWIVLDWCFMPNHHHLVVQLTKGGLSEGLREFHGCFSRWSNSQTGRTGTGHVWKNRFQSLDVVKEGHFWSLAPLRPASIQSSRISPPMPEDWPWSGFRATAGIDYPYRFHRPAVLLRYFECEARRCVRSRTALFVDEDPTASIDDVSWL